MAAGTFRQLRLVFEGSDKGVPFGPEASIQVTSLGSTKQHPNIVGHKCASIEEFEAFIDELKDNLEDIRMKARRKFRENRAR